MATKRKPESSGEVPNSTDVIDLAFERCGDEGLAREVLHKHGRLIDAQIRSERLEHGSKRAMIAFRSVLTLGALIVLGAFLSMVVSAREDHGLVIEALSVPPDLAQRGLTGETVAAGLADRLAVIDRTARSFRSPRTMTVNWGDDVKIQIPETGVSIGDLDAFLRRELGQQTIIGGAVFRTPAGLHVTVRAGGGGAVDLTGSDRDFDAMLQKAAEGVFEKTQAYRYSKYLEFTGRRAEAMAVARQLAATSDDPSERAWAWAQVSNLLDNAGDLKGAVVAGKIAIEQDPKNALAYLNLSIALGQLSHDRESEPYGIKAAQLGSTSEGGLSDVGINTSQTNLSNGPAQRGDFQESLRRLDAVTRGPMYPGVAELNRARIAELLAAQHDFSGSRAASGNPGDVYLTTHFATNGGLSMPQFSQDMDQEDWAAALRQTNLDLEALKNDPEGEAIADIVRSRHVLPRQAEALALSGRLDEAGAVASSLPLDCANCASARMAVAALAGDYPTALHWYRQAIQWGGDTPFSATDLGTILQRQGHYREALKLADEALNYGPKYPDAHKLRGDALRKLGRLNDSVVEYGKAAAGAPRWGRLQIDWAVAELRLGDLAAARQHLASAGTMDLNSADRALLARLAAFAASVAQRRSGV